jgi:mannose PTS system EIIA component
MPGLLIVAHEPLATALHAVAAHVFADRARAAVAVDVAADWSPERAEEAVLAAARQVAGTSPDGEVLILTDVFGATPSNAAQRVADGSRWRVVAGVNVPMLWRAFAYADLALDALVDKALAGGAQGVMPGSTQRRQDQALNSSMHDPSHRHHQQ